MADEDEIQENEDGEENEGEEEGETKKKLSGRTLILFIVLPLVAVAGIGIGVLQFLGGDDEEEPVDHLAEETPQLQDPTLVNFIDLEEMLVNIRTPNQRSTFLSLKVSLELNKDEDTEMLNLAMPRIRDKFQVYLRELRLEDLAGASGTQRVKEELLRRVNIAASPVKVNAVLIREMVVQ
jgi:flagellar FliL protein